jgi:hypothetical protein
MKKTLMIGYTLAILVVGIVVGTFCGGSNSVSAQGGPIITECLYAKQEGQSVAVYMVGYCIQQGKILKYSDIQGGVRIEAK